MIKALENKYALSNQGAKDLLKGIIYSVLANISLMFPVILLAIVLNQLLAPILGMNAPEISAIVYTVIGIVILAVVFIFHYCQYTAAYLGTYDESARRRISLAEKLRTLPLTFFHQRDIADLTSTIMGDCANFEHAFSHTVPQFFGAVISTGIVCVGLLIFNWQMGLALLWVAPISFAIVLLSRKWQEKLSKKHMNARLELAEGIQECLETVQDIKACNQEEDYLRKLDAKMDAAEKAQISSEMTTASLLTTGQMFLRLGLATVQTDTILLSIMSGFLMRRTSRCCGMSHLLQSRDRLPHWSARLVAVKVRLQSWLPNFIPWMEEESFWAEPISLRSIQPC